MESTTNEFVKLFRERLKYPIITVYGIFLIVYNWDILLTLLLSKTPIEYRIEYIKTLYDNPYYERLWIPLLKAIIVSLAAPLIMLLLEYTQKYINEPRQNIKDDKALKVWQAKAKIAHEEYIYAENKSGSKTITELRTKANELLTQLTDLQEHNSQQLKVEKDNYIALQTTSSTQAEIIEKNNTVIAQQENNFHDLQERNTGHVKLIKDFIDNFCKNHMVSIDIFKDVLYALNNGNNNFSTVTNYLNSKNYRLNVAKVEPILKAMHNDKIIDINGNGIFLTDNGKKLVHLFGIF